MQQTRIKICGIVEPAHAGAAADAGADFVGSVFVEQSPRFVTIDQAKRIAEALPDRVDGVGLFVDRSADEIKHIAKRVGISVVQLHGHEKPAILEKLDGLRVWKALPFGPDLLAEAEPWDNDPRVEALLIDAPPSGTLTGGGGEVFDWSALAGFIDKLSTPIILAGGLTPDNVREAIRIVKPFAVDVSSGVESSRGVKDVGLIEAFCEAVQNADLELNQQ